MGYIANVPTSMAERAVKGGSITIHANEVVINPAAQLDISGGSIRYLDGYVRTTRVVGADGRIYDVGSAPADQIYVGLAGGFSRISAHWGIVETWTSPFGKGSGMETPCKVSAMAASRSGSPVVSSNLTRVTCPAAPIQKLIANR